MADQIKVVHILESCCLLSCYLLAGGEEEEEEEAVFIRGVNTNEDPPNAHQAQHRYEDIG